MNELDFQIHAQDGKPVVEYGGRRFADPLDFSRSISSSTPLLPSAAKLLGKAFALLVAASLPPRNEVNRYNLSKYSDQYYIGLKGDEINRAFDDGFHEAIDKMLHVHARGENHVEALARELGYSEQ